MPDKRFTEYDPQLIALYEKSAKKYLPEDLKILLIAESPPPLRDGVPRYFYFDKLSKPENLFHGIMAALWENDNPISIDNKPSYLRKFSDLGLFLIDSIKFSIYKLKNDKRIISTIKAERQNILKQIELLNPEHIILIHPRVHAGLYTFLTDCGLTILNTSPIEFPIIGQDQFERFKKQFRQTLNKGKFKYY